MPSQNMQSRQELLKSLSNERLDMITRAAEAKRLLATFVYKGYDDPFAKGRLLETISKCEFRVKEIDTQLEQLRKVEL
jgi:hypothetical protein